MRAQCSAAQQAQSTTQSHTALMSNRPLSPLLAARAQTDDVLSALLHSALAPQRAITSNLRPPPPTLFRTAAAVAAAAAAPARPPPPIALAAHTLTASPPPSAPAPHVNAAMYGLLDRAAALQRQAAEEGAAVRPSTPTEEELERLEADEIVASLAVDKVSSTAQHAQIASIHARLPHSLAPLHCVVCALCRRSDASWPRRGSRRNCACGSLQGGHLSLPKSRRIKRSACRRCWRNGGG